jgi:hypothetical protein
MSTKKVNDKYKNKKTNTTIMKPVTKTIKFSVEEYTAFPEKLIVAQITAELYIFTEAEIQLLFSGKSNFKPHSDAVQSHPHSDTLFFQD